MERWNKPLWIALATVVAACIGYLIFATWPGRSPLGRTPETPPLQALPTPSPALSGDPIRIAAVLPLTGSEAPLGRSMLQAAQMAEAEMNAGGGAGGRPVQVIPVDGACDSATAKKNLADSLKAAPIEGIVGGVCSEETLGIAGIAEADRIIAIAPSGSDDRITKAGRFVFRLVPSDYAVAAAQTEYDRTHGKGATLRPYYDERAPAAEAFFRDYRRYFDHDPVPPWYLANEYSAVKAIAALISSSTPKDALPDVLVRDGLAPTGALPAEAFDRNGDPIWKGFVVSETRGGKTVDTGTFDLK